jgi:hypothetical protein
MSLLLPILTGSALGIVYSQRNQQAAAARDRDQKPAIDPRATRTPLLQRPKVNTESGAQIEGWGLSAPVKVHPGNQPYWNRSYAQESAARATEFHNRQVTGYQPISEQGYQPAWRPPLI